MSRWLAEVSSGADTTDVVEYRVMVMAQVNWGSVPDWLAGTGAVLALIFAFFAVMASHKTSIVQGLQLKAMQEDRARLQAGRVAAWIVEQNEEPICRVQNGSELPVFATHVLLRYWARETVGAKGTRWWRRISLWTVPPGIIDLPISISDGPVGQLKAGSIQAAIIFADAQGMLWKREIDGELTQIEKNDMADIFDSSGENWIEANAVPTLDAHLRGFDVG